LLKTEIFVTRPQCVNHTSVLNASADLEQENSVIITWTVLTLMDFPVLAGCIVVVIIRTSVEIDSISFFEGGGGRKLVEWLSGSCKHCDKFAS
jgi:hypothetical protein